MFYDPDGRAVEYIGNGRVKIEARDIYGVLQTLYMPQADSIKLVTGQAAGYGPYSQAMGGTNPEGLFRLRYGVPDLTTEAGLAEYKARANAVLENFFGPGAEITKGIDENTKDVSTVVVNSSLIFFGLGAGAESGFALVRGLTYTAEAGLSGYAVYDGVGNIYEGIQDGNVKQVAWGTFETATGALGGYGSVRALAGEIRAASGADLLVIDDALLDAYVAESLAPVAQQNTFVVPSQSSQALRQEIVYRAATSEDILNILSGRGIQGKALNGSWTAAEHIANHSKFRRLPGGANTNSPWISTTSDINIAKFYNQRERNGIIVIDLSKVNSPNTRLWELIPRENSVQYPPSNIVEVLGYHRSIWSQETTVFGHIPKKR